MALLAPLLESLLILGLAVLALLSLHLLTLTTLRWLLPERPRSMRLPAEEALPTVLVQLPLYNEGELVERALASIAALDWPRERLVIQVLDDSTDGSLAASRRAVAGLRLRGWRVSLHHRTLRSGFKAGALAAGLEVCDAPFVAIFDADFMPAPDFLRRTIGVLLADSNLGHVQARWLHANRDASMLTRAQARLLDGHFRVEQAVRHRLGLPVPFNGTCGVWRRAAIEGAGGWSGDTLTEDLDLSLRARLVGWSSAYLEDLGVPGELPVSARAWRAQQFRWTKGFVQCLRKLAPQIGASRLPLWQKILISLQLAQPLSFLAGTLCLLTALPFIAGKLVPGTALTVMALATTSIGLLGPLGMLFTGGFVGGSEQRPPVKVLMRDAAAALLLTSGLLLSNARASLEALVGIRSPFVRTPKGVGGGRGERRWRLLLAGLPELSAGYALLLFVLVESPLALPALALAISGLLGLGSLLRRDAAFARLGATAAVIGAVAPALEPAPVILSLPPHSGGRPAQTEELASWAPGEAARVGLRSDSGV
ncbi:MAG: glycosyltransferase [Thiohalocapsa sp.]|jgi:cellulose synthase/poly-beta-1,6-N-acetylglucosamine synthase-like glycosyltransferase|uniref:glycosyltransferase family 2 protein n=1 Tax=Thiohalocapsa sp. TaxID=2497641 RepID=UPI0025FB0B9E|nr:glycosyltransferase [Thiohalocapsa sp.]MCG6942996.1 glycosyltransferase [Thiohalocapsa sp.]